MSWTPCPISDRPCLAARVGLAKPEQAQRSVASAAFALASLLATRPASGRQQAGSCKMLGLQPIAVVLLQLVDLGHRHVADVGLARMQPRVVVVVVLGDEEGLERLDGRGERRSE